MTDAILYIIPENHSNPEHKNRKRTLQYLAIIDAIVCFAEGLDARDVSRADRNIYGIEDMTLWNRTGPIKEVSDAATRFLKDHLENRDTIDKAVNELRQMEADIQNRLSQLQNQYLQDQDINKFQAGQLALFNELDHCTKAVEDARLKQAQLEAEFDREVNGIRHKVSTDGSASFRNDIEALMNSCNYRNNISFRTDIHYKYLLYKRNKKFAKNMRERMAILLQDKSKPRIFALSVGAKHVKYDPKLPIPDKYKRANTVASVLSLEVIFGPHISIGNQNVTIDYTSSSARDVAEKARELCAERPSPIGDRVKATLDNLLNSNGELIIPP